MSEQKPFDPASDFDNIADSIRRDVAKLVLPWLDVPVFQALPAERRLACVMAGLTTGLVGTCFSMIEAGGRDEMMVAIEDYLPQAREHCEAIQDET